LKFLIDECLSPALVPIAHAAGHESYHVAHIGLASAEDWVVASRAVGRDLILVTNNASDFLSLFARFPFHAGLLIIVPSVERETQICLFEALLARLAAMGEPVNLVIEARLDEDDIRLVLYQWPPA
jgi:predicted nuclease of predicted toxin-antitoxin system